LQVAQGQASRSQAKVQALLCPSDQSISRPFGEQNTDLGRGDGGTVNGAFGRAFALLLVFSDKTDTFVAHGSILQGTENRDQGSGVRGLGAREFSNGLKVWGEDRGAELRLLSRSPK